MQKQEVKIPGVTGNFGFGVQNEVGQRLTEFFSECTVRRKHPLPTTQETTQQTDTTNGQYQNQIDFILCSQRWRSSIQSAKTRPGADCDSDHELLTAKFRLKLKKVGKTTRPFTSVAQSCLTPKSGVRLANDPVDCSTPVIPVHHQLPELAQTHVH